MNRSQVYHLLKTHYDRTGREMSTVELIIEVIVACGKTDPAQLMAGRRLFDTYLNQRRKTA
jgi:hypothetical protein